MKKILNPFIVESLRDEYSKRESASYFLDLYKADTPNIKDMNSAFFWNKKFKDGESEKNGYMTRDRRMILARRVNQRRGRYLNVGIGNAQFEIENLDKDKFEIFGIDISDVSINQAKEKIPEGKFSVSSIDKIPFNTKFDVVLVSEVLEHIKPHITLKSLKLIYKKMKHGSLLIVTIPINEGLEEMISMQFNPNSHIRAYTQNIIKYELELTGFKVKDIYELYAFKKFYHLKKLFVKFFPLSRYKPNNLILIATKK